MPQLIEETHKKGIRWNLIIDPNVEAYDYPGGKNYPPFTDGYNNEVYIKWDKSVPKEKRYNPSNAPLDKDVFYGRVWTYGPEAYPDFFKNKTFDWYKRSLSRLHNDLGMKFDALWLVYILIINITGMAIGPTYLGTYATMEGLIGQTKFFAALSAAMGGPALPDRRVLV